MAADRAQVTQCHKAGLPSFRDSRPSSGDDGASAASARSPTGADLRLAPPKDRDFALALGPVVVTPDELDPDGLEGSSGSTGRSACAGGPSEASTGKSREHTQPTGTSAARRGTSSSGRRSSSWTASSPGSTVELDVAGIGVLSQSVAA